LAASLVLQPAEVHSLMVIEYSAYDESFLTSTLREVALMQFALSGNNVVHTCIFTITPFETSGCVHLTNSAPTPLCLTTGVAASSGTASAVVNVLDGPIVAPALVKARTLNMYFVAGFSPSTANDRDGAFTLADFVLLASALCSRQNRVYRTITPFGVSGVAHDALVLSFDVD